MHRRALVLLVLLFASPARGEEAAPIRAEHDPMLDSRLMVESSLSTPATSEFLEAASGMVCLEGKLWVISDNTLQFGYFDLDWDEFRVFDLPAGPDGERNFSRRLGNHARKPDFEALAALPGGDSLLAIGSGGFQSGRTIFWIDARSGTIVRLAADELFEALAALPAVAPRLNIEGAVVTGEGSQARLLLFHRANERRADGTFGHNAILDVPLEDVVTGKSPQDVRIRTFDLGEVGGVPYGFSDVTYAHGQLHFVASAEGEDGELLGTIFGRIDADTGRARYGRIVDAETGRPTRRKLEGLSFDTRDYLFYAVDDPDAEGPSSVYRLARTTRFVDPLPSAVPAGVEIARDADTRRRTSTATGRTSGAGSPR